jgi:hypothetical protein
MIASGRALDVVAAESQLDEQSAAENRWSDHLVGAGGGG